MIRISAIKKCISPQLYFTPGITQLKGIKWNPKTIYEKKIFIQTNQKSKNHQTKKISIAQVKKKLNIVILLFINVTSYYKGSWGASAHWSSEIIIHSFKRKKTEEKRKEKEGKKGAMEWRREKKEKKAIEWSK
jgi:hypothetical protein